MRIAAEIMLDRVADSPTGDEDTIARYVNDEFMPKPGQHLFIQGDDGEAEYVVTSTNAWHEDMQPGMTEAQMHTEQPEQSEQSEASRRRTRTPQHQHSDS